MKKGFDSKKVAALPQPWQHDDDEYSTSLSLDENDDADLAVPGPLRNGGLMPKALDKVAEQEPMHQQLENEAQQNIVGVPPVPVCEKGSSYFHTYGVQFVLLPLFLAMQFLGMLMGFFTTGKCPIVPALPVSFGMTCLIGLMLTAFFVLKVKFEDQRYGLIVEGFVAIALLIFFILITTLAFSYQPNFDDPNSNSYCDPFVFHTAKAVSITIMLALAIGCIMLMWFSFRQTNVDKSVTV